MILVCRFHFTLRYITIETYYCEIARYFILLLWYFDKKYQASIIYRYREIKRFHLCLKARYSCVSVKHSILFYHFTLSDSNERCAAIASFFRAFRKFSCSSMRFGISSSGNIFMQPLALQPSHIHIGCFLQLIAEYLW